MHIDMGNGGYITANCGHINGCKIDLSVPRIGEMIVTVEGLRRRVIEVSRKYKEDNTCHVSVRTEDV